MMEYTYENFLKFIGLTEEEFIKEINKLPVVFVNKDIILKDSHIEGKGCFTTKAYEPEEVIGSCGNGKYKTELGRYVNHSMHPNIYLEKGHFIALTFIPPDTELLVNYFHNLATMYEEGLIEIKKGTSY